MKKRDQWGLKKYVERPESEWLRQSAPELRIVPEALWNVAHARLATFRAAYLRSTNGQLHGRPSAGVESKYLLTGLATCAVCGGGMIVKSRDYGSRRKFAYTCAYHHQRGRSVCENGLEVPMVATDHEVLSTIETRVLHPAVVDATIRKVLDALRPSADTRDARREALTKSLAKLDDELARLAAAIAHGGDLGSLLQALKAREATRDQHRAELASLGQPAHGDGLRCPATRARGSGAAHGLAGAAASADHAGSADHPEAAGGAVRVYAGRRPGGRYYEFAGQGALDKLLAGIIRPSSVVTPAGFEPAISTLKGSCPGPG